MDVVVVDKQDAVENTVLPHEIFCRRDVFGFVFVLVFLFYPGFLLRQGHRAEEPGADDRGTTKKNAASGDRLEHDVLRFSPWSYYLDVNLPIKVRPVQAAL